MSRILALALFALAVLSNYESTLAEQKDASSLKTEYFSITIPSGWHMPAPPREQPFGGVSAAFVKEGSDIAVTLNFLRGDIPASKFAENMAQDMQKNGMKASRPVSDHGLYKFSISSKANGIAWIGSNAGICTATLVFGNEPSEANELLKAIMPVNKNLLPNSVK